MRRALESERKPQSSPIRHELLALLTFSCSALVLLAIFTFSEFDTDKQFGVDNFNNWLGPIGAWIALKLLVGLGFFSVLLPLVGFMVSLKLFLREPHQFFTQKSFGIMLAIIFFMPLISQLVQSPFKETFLFAGASGDLMRRGLLLCVSTGGLWLIGLTGIFCGWLMILGRPFIVSFLGATLKKIKASRTPELLYQKISTSIVPKLSLHPQPLEKKPSEESLEKNLHVSQPKMASNNLSSPVAHASPKEPIIRQRETIVPIMPPVDERENLLVTKPVVADDEFAPLKILPLKNSIPQTARDITMVPAPIQIVERNHEASLRALKDAEKETSKKEFSFTLPPLNLLDYDAPVQDTIEPSKLKREADKLQRAFLQFGIEGQIREIRPGPVVTNYEFVPAPGIKLSRIAALSDDIAMAMSAVQVRIVTPIPGKGAVGIEVPNEKRETVYLKEIVADERYRKAPQKLCMAVGKDVEGNPYFMNLADMPHVLIAGTTGSGKSVNVNAMICSILYRATPKDVRFLMIDPKMLELSIYNGIPHLLLPPIIDSKKAANALRWAVKEMDERYGLMKEACVRDIASYNEKIASIDPSSLKEVDGRKHEHLPFIVVVVDEYADLLAIAGKEVESYIMRLAQKARACGIHVMLATQRPSVDVITGVIKANFPVRMGFRLASSHDSKTIINKTGAEKLLGRGDVLIMPPGSSDLYRIHGAFISEKELSRVVEFLSAQKAPEYRNDIAEFGEGSDGIDGNFLTDKSDMDEKFSDALAIVREHNRCSTSFLQRHLSIGYNRAAKIVESMEKAGYVGPVQNARGDREIFLD